MTSYNQENATDTVDDFLLFVYLIIQYQKFIV